MLIKQQTLRFAIPMGLAAGFIASLGVQYFDMLKLSTYYGILPLIPVLAWGVLLYFWSARRQKVRSLGRRLGWTVLAVLPFPLLFGLNMATGYFPFITTEPGSGQFTYAALLAFLTAGFALVFLGKARAALPQYGSAPALWLLCTGIGLAVLQTCFALSGPNFGRLIGFAAVLGITVLFPLPDPQSAVQTEEDPPPPEPRKHEKPVQRKTGAKPAQRTPSVSASQPIIPGLSNPMLIQSLGLAALLWLVLWLLHTGRELVQFTFPAPNLPTIFYPVVLCSLAIGLWLGRAAAEKQGIAFLLSGIAIAAFAVVVGFWRYHDDLFSALYIAYYNDQSTAYQLAEWMFWHALLPAVGVGMALTSFTRRQYCMIPHWAVPSAITLGVVMWVLLHSILTEVPLLWTIVILGLAAGGIVLLGTARSRFYRFAPIAATLGAVVLLLIYSPGTFNNLFDPGAFRALYTELTPIGSVTLVQSREYDDPFYATMYNQSDPLTQTSLSVQEDLYLFGHLPMLLHNAPKSVLALGYGSGFAIRAVEKYDPDSIVCVEPSYPMIRLAARQFHGEKRDTSWAKIGFRAERLPAFLKRNTEKFDVVISAEPLASPFRDPRIFTEEYYRDVRQSLAKGGVFVQWLPLATISETGVKQVAAAIGKAFPYTELWLGSLSGENPMVGIIAADTPPPGSATIRNGLKHLLVKPADAFHLFEIGLPSWEFVLKNYGMSQPALKQWIADATPPDVLTLPEMNTGATATHPSTSFADLLNRRTFDVRLYANESDTPRTRTDDLFASRPQVYRLALTAPNAPPGDTTLVNQFRAIINPNPFNLEAKKQLSEIMLRNAADMISQKRYAQAMATINGVITLRPLNTFMLRLMLIAALELDDKETSRACVRGIRQLNPKHAGFRDNQAAILARKGMIEDALMIYESAITADRFNEELYCNMATLQANIGRFWEAVRITDNAIDQSYYPAKPYFLRGMFYEQGGKKELAIKSYELYFTVAKPNDPLRKDAEDALARVKQSSGAATPGGTGVLQ